ncbi:myelin protein zero-like protein 2b [Pimephales promelas]|uniref:myelin protein zero-like protein 2b n=1 Tax=Pimephales promelas TaxID=90988 RepID=UPI001955D160|nr:myelin protein zero-like protein 2b [Pimephales promelas]KAG1958911.1 myelin protein zero-like protein [Pimephales promelas]
MSRIWIYLCSALCALVLSGVYQVKGMEVFTSSELEAVNGTNVRLKCTFKSTLPLSEERTSVSWSFKPLGKTTAEMIFHYQEIVYPPMDGLFKDHAVWSGDVMNGDGSITLQDVQFNFNGTYSCQVRNPPDIQGFASEISLRVVQKVSFSEIGILAIAVGGSIGFILIILTIYIIVRVFRRRDYDKGVEMEDHRSKEMLRESE